MEITESLSGQVPVSIIGEAPLEATPTEVCPSSTDNKPSKPWKMTKVVINQRRYKSGYVVKNEAWKAFPDLDEPVLIKAAYNLKGEYIGDPKTARFLCVTCKIKPVKASKDHSVCSIGYCKRQRKWYGWSHRAMCGFGIGDKLFEENYRAHASEKVRDNIPFVKHGSVIIRNLKQAKQAAINFAASVS